MIIFASTYFINSAMEQIIAYCTICKRLSLSKTEKIRNAIAQLASEGIALTMADFLGIGGYNICFINPNNKNEVIRIYFQCNIDVAVETIRILKTSLEVMPTPTHVSINRVNSGINYMYVSVPKLIPVLLITSEQMAKELHRTSVEYFDYMLSNGFFNLDVKIDNIGYNTATHKYQMMDIDCQKRKDFPKFNPIRLRNVDEALFIASFAPILRYGMPAYAFAIALRRFGHRVDFEYDSLSARDFFKVYSWLIGVHFYQEYIFTNHVANSKLHHSLGPEEVYAKRDHSIYEGGLKEIVNLNCFDSQTIYISDELEEEASTTDFSVDSLSLEKVRSFLPIDLPDNLDVNDGELEYVGNLLYNQIYITDFEFNCLATDEEEY